MRNNTKSYDRKPDSYRKGEQGFTLIELTIAMVMFLIVSGSIYGILAVAQSSRSVVNKQVPLTKSTRLGLNILGRDAYNAGYGYPLDSTVVLPNNTISALLGIPDDSNPGRDTVPPIIAGNEITENTFNTAAGVFTDQVTFLFKDTTFNVGPITEPILTRRFSQPFGILFDATVPVGAGFNQIIPISGSNDQCSPNDLFLISDGGGSTLGIATSLVDADKVQFADGDALGLNQTGSLDSLNGITPPATMQKVHMVTYFVTPDGILMRREFGNSEFGPPFSDEPLVYGVEDFQIQYVMDDGQVFDNPADPDGIPASGDENQTLLAAVRQIRFTISVRSTEDFGTGPNATQPIRNTMTSTFSTRNLGYDAN